MESIEKLIKMLKDLPPEMLEGKIKILEVEEVMEVSPRVEKLMKLFEGLDEDEQMQFHKLAYPDCNWMDKKKKGEDEDYDI